MIKKAVTIELQERMEARPIAMLVQVASQFESQIYMETDNKKVNAKSIMGMMTLYLMPGEEVVITAEGKDESQAVDDIASYLKNN